MTERIIPIAELVIDPQIQLAARGLRQDVVDDYAAAMANGIKFPVLVVVQDTAGTLLLADGFHRLAACQQRGFDVIKAEVLPGTRQDAMVHAATANTPHGLPLDRAQKQEAGQRLLQLTSWSNRQIALKLAVDHATVGRWRKALNLSGANAPDSPTRTVTRGGTTYEMDVSNLVQDPESQPPAPLDDVAPEDEWYEGELWGPEGAEDEPVDEESGEIHSARQRAHDKAAQYRAARQAPAPPEPETRPVNGNGDQLLYDLVVEGEDEAAPGWLDDEEEPLPAFDPDTEREWRPQPKPPAPSKRRRSRPPQQTAAEFDRHEELLTRVNCAADLLRDLAASLVLAASESPVAQDAIVRPAQRLAEIADYLQHGSAVNEQDIS